jgi:uncharacterized protein
MTRSLAVLTLTLTVFLVSAANPAPKPSFRVVAFYTDKGEQDHIDFARQALTFFGELAKKDGFDFASTTQWDDSNATKLKQFDVVLWLNDSPHSDQQRVAFQDYMEHGGRWAGFHFAGYNDESTRWPWFVDFLGGAVFYGNNWPPLPATLDVDDRSCPATQHLPAAFTSPANEWYIWKPSPRQNKDVKVLLTLDPSNYPLGLKDTITGGDLPVAWTNTRYRMMYMNMGHGDKIFTSAQQNKLFEDSLLWLASRK